MNSKDASAEAMLLLLEDFYRSCDHADMEANKFLAEI